MEAFGRRCVLILCFFVSIKCQNQNLALQRTQVLGFNLQNIYYTNASLFNNNKDVTTTPNLDPCRIVHGQIQGQWRCNSGQIISCRDLCNGGRHCADGSDETLLICRHVFCLNTAFRCEYGGCIAPEKECDGVSDCFDGSDEKTINCPGVLSTFQRKGNCSEGFFQCKSKDCIYEDQVCNGRPECRDGSDETRALCLTHYCNESGFKCNYGGCVTLQSRCNGKLDCLDASDESRELCAKLGGLWNRNIN